MALAATQVAKPHADNHSEAGEGPAHILSPESRGEHPVKFLTKKRVAAAVAALAIGGSGIPALAYWAGTRSGPRGGSAAPPSSPPLHPTTPGPGLFPGGAAGTLGGPLFKTHSGPGVIPA